MAEEELNGRQPETEETAQAGPQPAAGPPGGEGEPACAGQD